MREVALWSAILQTGRKRESTRIEANRFRVRKIDDNNNEWDADERGITRKNPVKKNPRLSAFIRVQFVN